MSRDYSATMSRLQTEELVRIISRDPLDDYEPEAVAAAEAELDKRDVKSEARDELFAEISRDLAWEKAETSASLDNKDMMFFLLVGPFLIISLPLALSYGMRGMNVKMRFAFKTIWLSFAIWTVAILIVIALLSLFGF